MGTTRKAIRRTTAGAINRYAVILSFLFLPCRLPVFFIALPSLKKAAGYRARVSGSFANLIRIDYSA
jgi:hypothetical protein